MARGWEAGERETSQGERFDFGSVEAAFIAISPENAVNPSR